MYVTIVVLHFHALIATWSVIFTSCVSASQPTYSWKYYRQDV